MKKIRKAIIPAAGLGTRFLPATKSVPKEMLPIIDRPILLYIVEEAVRSGIEDIVLIAGRGKSAIEDFFDVTYELEHKLEREGKSDWLESIQRIHSMANVISIRQKQPLGLGHAVYCGRPVVGDEPFAVLLGDEIMISDKTQVPVTESLIKSYEAVGCSSVAIMKVADSEVSKYGIVEGDLKADKLLHASRVIEKPEITQTTSRWALPGRYVFSSEIFDFLKDAKPGKNGEIQLTDAMTLIAKSSGLVGVEFQARRFDAGDKFGYLQANIELALEHPELSVKMKEFIKALAQRI